MQNKLAIVMAALLFCGGCSWFGWGDNSSTTAVQETPVADNAPEVTAPAEPKKSTTKPAAKTSTKKTTAKTAKGAKSEAQIKAELDQMGKKLAAQSARTLLPNKANKEVKQVGGQWVATYIEVDPTHVTTELRPGANGQYVGFIRYSEHIMECRGATRAEALKAPCQEARTRNLNELIRYDGRQWQD